MGQLAPSPPPYTRLWNCAFKDSNENQKCLFDKDNRTSGPAATRVASNTGFLGGGGRLFFCTAFNHALTRLLLLAFRLYVNRPPLLAAAVVPVGSWCSCCWPPPLSSHKIVDHGDGGPAAAGGGNTYNIIPRFKCVHKLLSEK